MSEGTDIQASPSRRHIIKRPRLTRLLDETKARCILLVAPAGYGKTTLAEEWTTAGIRAATWYRSGRSAADLAAFAAGFAEAVATFAPSAPHRIGEHLRAAQQHGFHVETLADILAEELAEWPPNAWLVVDDYQHARDSAESESFVERVFDRSKVQLLITSRVRPAWTTARRLLYGELYELSQRDLAMTVGEVAEVDPRLEHSRFTARAAGWPAVIGLAARASDVEVLTEHAVQSELHRYFAEELLRAATPSIRRDLMRVAIAPRPTRRFIDEFFGRRRATDIMRQGERLGFLQPDETDGARIHPLLRTFLLDKLLREPPEETERTALAVGRYLVANRAWDDAFEVVTQFRSRRLLVELCAAGLDELLSLGRVTSLEQWVGFADREDVQAPILTLAKADLALRARRLEEARALALHAASSPPVAARAYVVAGRSAHLSFDETRALDLHRRAESAATTATQRREAIWGQFLSACDLELAAAAEVLDRLEQVADDAPETRLQVATGRLALAARRGGMEESVALGRATLPFLLDAKDPLARTSFLNCLCDGLVTTAHYGEALTRIKDVLTEIEKYRLDFALPYVSLVRAAAEFGAGDADAASSISATVLAEYQWSDGHVRLTGRMVQARASLIRGDAERAFAILPEEDPSASARGLLGHYTALRALASLRMGEPATAEREAARARRLTSNLEAHALAMWTVVGCRFASGRPIDAPLRAALRLSFERGDFNSLVTTYRCVPGLLKYLSDLPRTRPRILDIVRRAGDTDLAQASGIAVGMRGEQEPQDVASLSSRERDVAQLLMQGMTNREIAKALFISDVTVKVHLRHIYAKINARSRTQAALKLQRGSERGGPLRAGRGGLLEPPA